MTLRGWIGAPTVALTLLVLPSDLPAQTASTAEARPAEVSARTYDVLFDELLRMRPSAEGAADVSNLVLQRDVARFTLQRGRLHLLSAVSGRTVGVVYKGDGIFSFAPPSRIERERLRRLEKGDSLESRFTELFLLFADGTAEELEAALKFGPGAGGDDLRGAVEAGLEFLADEDSRTFDPDFMSAWLNDERSELFFAYVKRQGRDPVAFSINPNELEGVRLQSRINRRGYDRHAEVITQFPSRSRGRSGSRSERLRQAEIEHYALDVSLPPTGIGEIGFAATATVRIVADTAVGPWVAFELFEKLKVDSASWENG
ncbi:MAG TPA: hypothetical protein VFR62_14840, partial [Gemmatimonadales bacterium]|nr:hypothetical protein [Gemmatimonadales bacterium]